KPDAGGSNRRTDMADPCYFWSSLGIYSGIYQQHHDQWIRQCYDAVLCLYFRDICRSAGYLFQDKRQTFKGNGTAKLYFRYFRSNGTGNLWYSASIKETVCHQLYRRMHWRRILWSI